MNHGAARLVAKAEHLVKKPIWDCRMCGQCVLHDTGMTCPMTCPKTLRNGPCGGVRADGYCEVNSQMRCVWLLAFAGAERIPGGIERIREIQAPVARRLEGHSSWLRLVRERTGLAPRVSAP